jgi:phosphate transport system substrate-binding protein
MFKSLIGAVGAAAVLFHASPVLAQVTVKIDGSSTVYPVTEAVAEEFRSSSQQAIQVTVGISGTGGGFKKFCRGETDISDASRPILASEMEEAKKNGIEYIELPIAFDALTVVVNPKSKITELTVDQLKRIWQPDAKGKIMKWNQVEPSWPDAPLKLYGPGTDSGTFDYFTEAVCEKSKASRNDYTASEDDNTLVQGVSMDVNALGYFGFAYYAENTTKLKAVAIINPKSGKAVLPSEQTVKDGTYQPLARPIFIYVNKKSAARPEVKKFVEFYLKEGGKLAKEVKYVALPDDAYAKAKDRFAKLQTGTIFGGVAEVGATIEELFTKPLTSEPKAAPEGKTEKK